MEQDTTWTSAAVPEGSFPENSSELAPTASLSAQIPTTGAESEETFRFRLPGGKLSVDNVSEVFNRLREGRCDEAENSLDGNVPLFGIPVGQEHLYRAAVAVCNQDLPTARVHLSQASLTGHKGDCPLFKAIVSVLDQRAQEGIQCPSPKLEDRPSTEPEEPGPDDSPEAPGSLDEPEAPGSDADLGPDPTDASTP
jgi:hypothetical protein